MSHNENTSRNRFNLLSDFRHISTFFAFVDFYIVYFMCLMNTTQLDSTRQAGADLIGS